MTEYNVRITADVKCRMTVEAASPEEAHEKAWELMETDQVDIYDMDVYEFDVRDVSNGFTGRAA